MQPYYQTHPIGVLYLLAVAGWYLMEIAQFFRQRQRQKNTSFQTLGRYFTFTVTVSPDQPVVTTGPYRLLRHPGYAGGLLATTGLGLMWGNWVSLATLTLLTLTFIVWRIRTEERALLARFDDRYRAYASNHKRLVPLIW